MNAATRARPASELRLRVISALVLAAMSLAAVAAGGLVFRVFVAVFGTLVYAEWLGIVGIAAFPRERLLALLALAAVLLVVVAVGPGAIAIAAAIAGAIAAIVLCTHTTTQTAQWAGAGFVYCALAVIAIAGLRGTDRSGLSAVIVLFAIVWATDIGAYFIGRRLRGPKLAPSISPGKTWSGAVGGVAVAVVGGFLASMVTGFGSPLVVAGLAVLLSVVSQIGDLFESHLKRRFRVKDSGWILPGHGGVFDRVDGLIPAAIAFYGLSRWFGWL